MTQERTNSDQWRAGKAKANKYRVSPKPDRTYMGIVFASKLEMSYYRDMLVPRADIVTALQVRVPLGPSGIVYVADFSVLDESGKIEYIDAKGVETPEFRLKCRLWWAHGPGPLRIVKKIRGEFRTVEVITPNQPRQRERKKRRSKR